MKRNKVFHINVNDIAKVLVETLHQGNLNEYSHLLKVGLLCKDGNLDTLCTLTDNKRFWRNCFDVFAMRCPYSKWILKEKFSLLREK